MQEIKLLLDPHNLFNPGVLLNDDKDVFVKNFKRRVKLDKQADKCLECGFCESVCPSRDLSLTPRQRLSVYKEMMILKETDKAKYKDYKKKYQYYGIDTCAATGLCGVQCPVEINTGSFIKDLRAEQNKANIIDSFMFKHFSGFATISNLALKISRGFSRVLGDNILRKSSLAVHKVLGNTPVWNSAMPTGAKSLKSIKQFEAGVTKPKVVYWPTCTTRIFGPSKDTNQNDTKQAALNILEKSGYEVIVPKGLSNTCCGQPFDSKGLYDKAEQKRQEVIELLKATSDNFSLPIVTDASPCSLRINDGMTDTKVYDSVAFIAEFCLDKLNIHKIGKLAVHQTCSTQKAGNQKYILAIANSLSDDVVIPRSVTCCGFAGDKGFTLPELNASALSGLKEEVKGCVCGISNSRTCEIGLSYHSGLTYYSAFDLLDKNSSSKFLNV
ncbi:4Fe-4S dicluster domain protein [Francisella philomiragia subsp. philomiragia ATCC 25015]|nr:4Fe-4S dicluster domain protein [Francisella philomiragia subsp. philomiragia ATCC 25015]